MGHIVTQSGATARSWPARLGRAILKAVRRPASPEEAAAATGLPLYRVRSGLREMAAAGLVAEKARRFSAIWRRPE
jgi:hypothetical protein